MSNRVLFLDTVHPILWESLERDKFICEEDLKCTKQELMAKIGSYEGIVIRSRLTLDKEILEYSTNLKFIARSGSGLENIDVDFANSLGIKCINSPEGNRDAVGEHALGMLLSLLNKIPQGNLEVRQGIWRREENRGVELGGKTVGIIGYGNTGSAFAEKLKGFNVDILAFDKLKSGFGSGNIKEVELSELQSKADIVSIHIPYNADNHHFVNDDFLSNFSKDIILVNTSRGKVLDTKSVVGQMKAGKLKGLCLDVFEYELPSFEKMNLSDMTHELRYLIESSSTILTPHVAGWTQESYYKLSKVLYDKIHKSYIDKTLH